MSATNSRIDKKHNAHSRSLRQVDGTKVAKDISSSIDASFSTAHYCVELRKGHAARPTFKIKSNNFYFQRRHSAKHLWKYVAIGLLGIRLQ